MPNWNAMDQKQRLMTIGGAVVLLVAVGLIIKSLVGGTPAGSTEVAPAVIEAVSESASTDTFKPPPAMSEQDVQIDEVPTGSKKGLQPTDQ